MKKIVCILLFLALSFVSVTPCYAMCVNQAYDKEAYDRVRTGLAYTEDIFAHDVKVGKFNQVCADRSVDADDLVCDISDQVECGDRNLLDS